MRKYRYKKVNAFTSENSKGNPAAYLMLGEEELSDEEMLSIGKEHSGFVSEVVFCSNSKEADCKLTYYSSECEVEFCGHGTIATMYDIITNDEQLRYKDKIQIETNKKGILKVYNSIKQDGVIYITAPKAQYFNKSIPQEEIASALNITMQSIDSKYPIDLLDAGLRTIIVPIRTLEREITVYPIESQLKEFCITNHIDIILMFSKETKNDKCIAHTRVFAPKYGYLEDPATGSGNSAFANYLLKHQLWNGEAVAVEQGGDNIEFNSVMIKCDRGNILFGGAATVVIDGYYIM